MVVIIKVKVALSSKCTENNTFHGFFNFNLRLTCDIKPKLKSSFRCAHQQFKIEEIALVQVTPKLKIPYVNTVSIGQPLLSLLLGDVRKNLIAFKIKHFGTWLDWQFFGVKEVFLNVENLHVCIWYYNSLVNYLGYVSKPFLIKSTERVGKVKANFCSIHVLPVSEI